MKKKIKNKKFRKIHKPIAFSNMPHAHRRSSIRPQAAKNKKNIDLKNFRSLIFIFVYDYYQH